MYATHAKHIFQAALKAVHPSSLIAPHIDHGHRGLFICGEKIDTRHAGKLIVIAVGKAAPDMAAAVEIKIGGAIAEGICITRYGHARPLKYFKTIEAGHPLPDNNSIEAGELVLRTINDLSGDDTVLLLLSGGASSLLADVPPGSMLEDLQQLVGLLIESGASIQEINTVRKKLSSLKGGGLAKAAYPAKVITMIISDVVGDDIGSIGSGPTYPDTTRFEELYHILIKYKIWPKLNERIKGYCINEMNRKQHQESNPAAYFKRNILKIVGNNLCSLQTAKAAAEAMGYNTVIVNDRMNGETTETAVHFVRSLLNYSGSLPACMLMSGETTLNVKRAGKGGRNQHFVLCCAKELLLLNEKQDERHVVIMGCGTDGTDGNTDATGAIVDAAVLKASPVPEVFLNNYLLNFDSYNYFLKYGGLVKTGPTGTNVMDLVIGLVIK